MEPITLALLIGSFIGGALVGTFWDEITKWVSQMLGYILDGINKAIEVTSDAIVSVVKEGSKFYQEVKVYVRNIRTGETRVESKRKEIPRSEVPSEIDEQLKQKTQIKLGQVPT